MRKWHDGHCSEYYQDFYTEIVDLCAKVVDIFANIVDSFTEIVDPRIMLLLVNLHDIKLAKDYSSCSFMHRVHTDLFLSTCWDSKYYEYTNPLIYCFSTKML